MAFIKLKQVGQALHVYTYQYEPLRAKRKKEKNPYKRIQPRRLERNAKRAKRAFVELVSANLVDRPALLTLTCRDTWDIAEGFSYLTSFGQSLRYRYPAFRYVGVPEFQKLGRVHFHLLVWGLPDKLVPVGYWGRNNRTGKRAFIHECLPGRGCERESRYLADLWGHGFVDLVPTDGSPKLASYLAKYMMKAITDPRLAGKRAYTSSRNLSRPVSFSSLKMPESVDRMLEMYGIKDIHSSDHLRLVREVSFDTLWLGRANYKLYSGFP